MSSISYIKSLDGFRGLAVLLVVLFHVKIYTTGFVSIGFGWVGVQFFFVLSGYLITRILLNAKKRAFSEYVRKFYVRRALRIFPIYFLYILIFIVAFLIFGKPEDFLMRLPYLLTYTYNYTRFVHEIGFNMLFAHLWSLSIEEQFYLIWPFIIFFASRRVLKGLIVGMIIFVPIIRLFVGWWASGFLYDLHEIGEAVYGFTLSQFDAFAMGGAITIFRLDEKDNRWKNRIFASASVLIILVLSFQYLSYNINGIEHDFLSWGLQIAELHNYQHVWSYTLLNIFSAACIIKLIDVNYVGLFNNRILVAIGKVSYGMYLYHLVILIIVAKFVKVGVLYVMICLIVTYIVSYFSYHVFEKRFISLKDRFAGK